MLDIQPILDVDNLITKELGIKRPQYVIAGGAIRDIVLGFEPRDWDVFCIGVDPDLLFKICELQFEQVREPLGRTVLEMDEHTGVRSHRFHTYEDAMGDTGGSIVDLGEWKIKDTIVNVLTSNYPQPQRYFDFAMNTGAYNDGNLWNVGAILKTKFTKIMGMQAPAVSIPFPEKVLERGHRFEEKFGFKMVEQDIATLELRAKGDNLLEHLGDSNEKMPDVQQVLTSGTPSVGASNS